MEVYPGVPLDPLLRGPKQPARALQRCPLRVHSHEALQVVDGSSRRHEQELGLDYFNVISRTCGTSSPLSFIYCS